MLWEYRTSGEKAANIPDEPNAVAQAVLGSHTVSVFYTPVGRIRSVRRSMWFGRSSGARRRRAAPTTSITSIIINHRQQSDPPTPHKPPVHPSPANIQITQSYFPGIPILLAWNSGAPWTHPRLRVWRRCRRPSRRSSRMLSRWPDNGHGTILL